MLIKKSFNIERTYFLKQKEKYWVNYSFIMLLLASLSQDISFVVLCKIVLANLAPYINTVCVIVNPVFVLFPEILGLWL